MIDTDAIFSALGAGVFLALQYWWVWLPLMLARIAYIMWLDYQKEKYLLGMKWVMLEITPPPEILYSSPKAAESFFAWLHASYGGGIKWKDQAFGGKVPDWFSIEIVSDSGDTHFYIRCTEGQRNGVEAALFAQYSQAEIRIVEDYTTMLPADFDPTTYDISGSDFVGTQPPAYPIKSWTEFEDAGGKDENARIDPLSPLLEIMSALTPGEHLWLQYVIRPTGGDWVKEGQKVVDKMAGREEKPAPAHIVVRILSIPVKIIEFFMTMFGLYTPPEEKKKEEKPFNLSSLTPADKLVLEQIQFKISKLAFKSTIRTVYIARKDAFNGARSASVSGMMKQLFYNNLNSFKPGNGTSDKGVVPWLFPGGKGFMASERTLKKKIGMYKAYIKRTFSPPSKNPKDYPLILNVEELATLWHMPALNVKAPLLPRVQAKKGQPPAMLPTR